MDEIIRKPKILLPKDWVDYQKWAVIACDQFTAQPEYWEKLKNFVGDSPSTLNLILPEAFLKGDVEGAIDSIDRTMDEYLHKGIFTEREMYVLTERTIDGVGKRLGLVASVDLEMYDYHRNRVPIRASEETIPARLPIRVKIREKAPIELPHILMLMDDPDKKIIEPLYKDRERLEKLYDFTLNMNGGHLRGWAVEDDDIAEKFMSLLDSDLQVKKYGVDAGVLFAVGDGNHSVAAAKQHWDNIKAGLTPEQRKNHPARYLLCEIINLYDDALVFEPIHRLVIGENFAKGLLEKVKNARGKFKTEFTLVTKAGDIKVISPLRSSDTIRLIQDYIEENAEKYGWEVEYVHGEGHTREVACNTGGTGILMPQFCCGELINYVVEKGNLPKKAFSIGTAENKKYYVEAKRIVE